MSEPLAEREDATPCEQPTEAQPAASGDTGVAEVSADALPAAPPADSATGMTEGPLHEPTTKACESLSATTRESDANVASNESGGRGDIDENGPAGRIVSFAGQDGTTDDGSAAYAADGAAEASPRDHAERDHLATTMSRPFTEDPSAVISADDAGAAAADELRPPLTEAELLRARLKEAAAFMQAQIEHATPSPVSRREKASAAADLALGMADLRHAEGLSQQQAKARSQRLLSRSVSAQAVTPPPSSSTRGDSSSLLHPEGSTLAMRRKPSTTPQPTLSYDWRNALASPNDAMSPARRRHNRPGAALSPHSPQAQSPGAVRRLPPLGSPSSPPLAGSTSPGSGGPTGQTRLRAAELAFSTQSRVNVADDERLKYEVQLAHLLEHNTALATQHAAASAQYATWLAYKKELEEQTADHRAFAFQVRSELRKAQARCVEAERQSLAWHAKLRDLSLKLQRSRLKQTAEERHLSTELREARAQLRELRQTGKDEDDNFDAALASRTKRAAIIEDQLRLFDPAAYVERCELEELQAEMQHRTVVNLSAAADPQSPSKHPTTTKSKPGDKKDAKVTLEEANGGSNQVDTSSSRFKTFHYTEGAEWASNNAPLPPPCSASPAEGPSITPPQTPPQGEGTGATPPSSSVKILDDIHAAKSAERAGRQHTHGSRDKHRSGAQDDADHDEVPDVTEHLVDARDAVVPTGPPPPSMRLEKALGAYKSALDMQQRDKSGGVKAHQARLKKFLRGEF